MTREQVLEEALRSAIKIADEAREEWDNAPSGMKAGKLLIALSGHLRGYRPDIDAVHSALASAQQEPAPAGDAEEVVGWEYKTANGWAKISLENYKILKGSSFELRPITRARASGEKGGADD